MASLSPSLPVSSSSSIRSRRSNIAQASGDGRSMIAQAGGRVSAENTAKNSNLLPNEQKWFRSRRVKKGEVERPWLKKRDPREKWVTIIPLIGIFIGMAVSGVIIWDGLRTVVNYKYCEILNDDFSSWNSKVWTKEVEVGGFG